MRAADNVGVASIWIADAAPCFWYSDGAVPAFDLVLVCIKPASMRQGSSSMASCIASRLMAAH